MLQARSPGATVALQIVRGDYVSRGAAEGPDCLRQLLASGGERSPVNRAGHWEDHVPALTLCRNIPDQRIEAVEAGQIDPRQTPLLGKAVLRPPFRRYAPGVGGRLRQVRQIIGRLIENAARGVKGDGPESRVLAKNRTHRRRYQRKSIAALGVGDQAEIVHMGV